MITRRSKGQMPLTRRKKIAYIVSQFPETFETFILREVVELISRNIDVEIFSLKQCNDQVVHPEAVVLKEKIHYRPFIASVSVIGALLRVAFRHPVRTVRALALAATVDLDVKHPVAGLIRTAKNIVVFPKSCSFARAIATGRFSHIHAHWANTPTTSALIVSELTCLPLSFTAHAFDIYKDNPRIEKKMKAAQFVVTCTDANRKHLESLSAGSTQVILNYHGLNPYQYDQNRRQSDQTVQMLAVGRLTETKGFQYLIAASAMLKKEGIAFHCTLVGEGELKASLKAALSDKMLSQHFTMPGLMKQKELRMLYQTSDIFIMPSVIAPDGDRDGIPNVVLEAMAAGLPIVATDISGLPEAVEHGRNGYLVPQRDAAELAQAMMTLARKPDLRKEMGNASRRVVMDRFVLETNVSQLVDLFEKEAAS